MLDGGITFVSLEPLKVENKYSINLSSIEHVFVNLIDEKAKESQKRDPNEVSIISLPLFFPLQIAKDDKLMLVARRPLHKGGRAHQSATFKE